MAGPFEEARETQKIRRHNKWLREIFSQTGEGRYRPASPRKRPMLLSSGLSTPASGAIGAGGSSGAFIHLTRDVTQSIPATGGLVEWTKINSQSSFRNLVTPMMSVSVEVERFYAVELSFDFASWTGASSVVLRKDGTRIFPPSEHEGTWNVSATNGRFSATVVGLEFSFGEGLEVFVDHGDSGPQDITSARLSFASMDRKRAVVSNEPPSGYIIRYQASSLSLADGADITSVTNEGSLANYDLTVPTGRTAPTYSAAGGPSGESTMQFRLDNRLETGSAPDVVVEEPLTHLYVAKLLTDGNAFIKAMRLPNDTRWVVSGTGFLRYGSGGDIVARDSNWHIISGRGARVDETDIYYDGDLLQENAFGTRINGLQFDPIAEDAARVDFDLTEWIVYEGRMTDDAYTNLTNYARQRYGL